MIRRTVHVMERITTFSVSRFEARMVTYVDLEALDGRYADSVFWRNATQPGQLDLFD